MLSLLIFRVPFTFFAVLLLIAAPTFRRAGLRGFSGWFFAYAGLFALSAVWSIDPFATLGKALELFIGIGIVLHLQSKDDAIYRLDALRTLLLRTVATIGGIVLIGYLSGSDAFVGKHVGLLGNTTAVAPFLSTNGVGYIAALLILSILAEWSVGRFTRRSALAQGSYAFLILLFAGSRTSLILIAVGIGVVLAYKSKRAGAAYFVILSAAAFVLRNKILKALEGNQVQTNFDTLSGRTIMWSAAIKDWAHRPLLGYGGGSGGKFVVTHLNFSSLQVLSSLHDGFMELLTGLGIVGFLLALGLLLGVTFSTVRSWKRTRSYAGNYVLIIHIWIVSLMSIGALGWMSYEMMLYLILISILDLQQRSRRAALLQPRESVRLRNRSAYA